MINLLLILLLVVGCDENPVSASNEIDVDWLLVKTPNMESSLEESLGIGYYFYFTNNSNITNLNLEEGCLYEDSMGDCHYNTILLNSDDGILSFTYNEEEFNFDLSDSYNYLNSVDEGYYNINTELEPLQRIIYNQEMNYSTLFGQDGFFGITLNSSSPNELIDYR